MEIIRALMISLLSLVLILPLQAQDNPTPYDIALQRIEQGVETDATSLYLSDLMLAELPPEIGQLSNLRMLWLSNNQLTNLPPEIGQLSNLRMLLLSNNQLTNLPPEIGQLSSLCYLDLNINKLTHLPTTLGNLSGLVQPGSCGIDIFSSNLVLYGNPLISPPPEVVEQGTDAVLAYVRNQAWYHMQRLIIAGAAGVGMLVLLVLGFRHKQRSGRKPKPKQAA